MNASRSPWMTVREAAEYLRKHPQTVIRLLHTEQLKGFQSSGRNGTWRVHRDDADAYLRNPPHTKRRLRSA